LAVLAPTRISHEQKRIGHKQIRSMLLTDIARTTLPTAYAPRKAKTDKNQVAGPLSSRIQVSVGDSTLKTDATASAADKTM
jgi:hypothetical protein